MSRRRSHQRGILHASVALLLTLLTRVAFAQSTSDAGTNAERDLDAGLRAGSPDAESNVPDAQTLVAPMHVIYVDAATTAPTEPPPQVVEIALARDHGFARMTDGTVRRWLQTGHDVQHDPTEHAMSATPVEGLHGVVEIAAAMNRFCARLSDGSIRCGDGSAAHLTAILGISSSTHIAVAETHACAQLGDRTVRCWGRNDTGALGDSTTVNRENPVQVVGLPPALQIAVGSLHSCARVVDGAVWCWGAAGAAHALLQVAPFAGLSGVEDLALANGTGCALLRDGTVHCWGRDFGPSPRAIPGLTQVTQLSGANDDYFCARMRDATVSCWGSVYIGHNEHTFEGSESLDPRPIVRATGAEQVAVGADEYRWGCARLTGRRVVCWDETGGDTDVANITEISP